MVDLKTSDPTEPKAVLFLIGDEQKLCANPIVECAVAENSNEPLISLRFEYDGGHLSPQRARILAARLNELADVLEAQKPDLYVHNKLYGGLVCKDCLSPKGTAHDPECSLTSDIREPKS